jgi:hypothetical protein
MLVRLAVLLTLAWLGGCGGSSSETPPPLRPLPPNVHYNRAATTLPGELGIPEAADSAATPTPEAPDAVKKLAPPAAE